MAEPASKKRKGNWGGLEARPKRGQMFRRKAGKAGPSRLPTSVYAGSRVARPLTVLNSFMPPKKKCIMHYADQYAVSALAAGTRTSQTIRGNGMYDPDQTGTGHQPRGFDQIAALYNYYCVTASSIRVRFSSAAAGNGVLIGLQADATVATAPVSTTVTEFMESFPYNVLCSNTDGSQSVVQLTDKRTTRAMSSTPVPDSENTSAVTTNPANEWYWKIVVFNANPTSSVTGSLFVDIWYEAEFSEPIEVGES